MTERELQLTHDRWEDVILHRAAAIEIGSKRIGKCLQALADAATEWGHMAADADAEYADEKLRLKMEQICGVPIPELFRL